MSDDTATLECAWLRLSFAIIEHRAAVPCQGDDAALWTSENRDEREAASYRCAGCPALDACRAYAEAAGERFGVWAAADRTPRGRVKVHDEPPMTSQSTVLSLDPKGPTS